VYECVYVCEFVYECMCVHTFAANAYIRGTHFETVKSLEQICTHYLAHVPVAPSSLTLFTTRKDIATYQKHTHMLSKIRCMSPSLL